jgi:hypothetical protein
LNNDKEWIEILKKSYLVPSLKMTLHGDILKWEKIKNNFRVFVCAVQKNNALLVDVAA